MVATYCKRLVLFQSGDNSSNSSEGWLLLSNVIGGCCLLQPMLLVQPTACITLPTCLLSRFVFLFSMLFKQRAKYCVFGPSVWSGETPPISKSNMCGKRLEHVQVCKGYSVTWMFVARLVSSNLGEKNQPDDRGIPT